jgi:hypothetical protein
MYINALAIIHKRAFLIIKKGGEIFSRLLLVATFFFAKNFVGRQKYARTRAYLKHGKEVFF